MKKERWPICNVIRTDKVGKHLWHLRAKSGGYTLVKDYAVMGSEALPAKVVTKDFQSLWQKKLNIAMLPAGDVFLGVVELPAVEPGELQGMLEFQLERLSPLPVTQIVWTYQPLPKRDGGLTRVILIIASRHSVEALLGRLEADGFLADRLELPMLDQLLHILERGDGLWVIPTRTEEQFSVITAWVAGGELRNLSLIPLPQTDWEETFKSQLTQTVWAAELEGWLDGAPACHLVADGDTAGLLEPPLREFSGRPVEVMAPLEPTELMQRTAGRSINRPLPMALLPAEYATRYRQLFVDRIWMRSLGAVLLIYIFGVLFYFMGIEWARHGLRDAEEQLAIIGQSYTNTVQLSQRVQILQNQMNLKFAALDSLRVIAEKLPEGMKLKNFNFSKGSEVTVYGEVPQTEATKIPEYVDQLQSYRVEGRPLFKSVSAPTIGTVPGTGLNTWNFVCELVNPEKP